VVSTPTENLWLPPSELEIDIARVNPQVIGTARYEVSFFKDKILLKKVPFVICVSRRRPVFIPIRNIDRGELLSKENVREVVQLITNEHLDSQLVDSVEELIGRQSKMPIKKGTAIKWFSLETNYLTKRGDAVQMIVRNGGMTLQTTGVAQQRGAKGDVITVKTKATGKVLKAKVLARGLVELVAS
jgi:flagella basal body P-ring formation protein FlgA